MKCDGVSLVMKSECYPMKKKSFFLCNEMKLDDDEGGGALVNAI